MITDLAEKVAGINAGGLSDVVIAVCCDCLGRRIHMTPAGFKEAFSEFKTQAHSLEFNKIYAEIDGVKMFALVRRDPELFE